MTGIGEILEEYPRMTYVVPFVSVLLAFFMFPWLNLQTDANSARYMISALVQSEAAIIAVVISLSLVAVQLTASSYSPRVTEIFRKAKDLWFLIGFYIFAIVFGLAVLKLIEEKNSSDCEIYILLVYYLSVFVFAALIPYLWITLNLLKPSTIIKELSKNITKENLLKGDPIQPIMDIVRGSIMKYDYETIEDGLDIMKNKICEMLLKEKFDEKEELDIFIKIFIHFSRIGRILIQKEDEYSIRNIIDKSRDIGKAEVMNNLQFAISLTLRFLREMGIASAKKELEEVSMHDIVLLENIGLILADKKLEDKVLSVLQSFKEVIIPLSEKEVEYISCLIGPLTTLGIASAKNGLINAVISAETQLSTIRYLAKSKGLHMIISDVDASIEKIKKAKEKSA